MHPTLCICALVVGVKDHLRSCVKHGLKGCIDTGLSKLRDEGSAHIAVFHKDDAWTVLALGPEQAVEASGGRDVLKTSSPPPQTPRPEPASRQCVEEVD